MKVSVTMVAFLLVAITITSQTCGAASVAATDIDGSNSYHFKRSLCNTFGGCGVKRSVPQQSAYVGLGGNTDELNEKNLILQNRRDPGAYLIAEIIADLLEYLQMNEKKHVLMAPRQYDIPMISSPMVTRNMQNNQAGTQELQVSRIYLNKNE